jgi:hypothetical protein
MDRMAIALEVLSTKDFGQNQGLAEVPKVEWTLRWFNGDTYILTNEGNAVAISVKITAHESLMTPSELPESEDVQPSEALTFMAARSLGTVDSTITVTWRDDSGNERTWRYPLPPRPPR